MNLSHFGEIAQAVIFTFIALSVVAFLWNKDVLNGKAALLLILAAIIFNWFSILFVPYQEPHSLRALLDQDPWWYSSWIPRILTAAAVVGAAWTTWHDSRY